jgi:membrane protein DedA with SNARE-associated domain
MPVVRYTVLTFIGTIPWCFGLAGVGAALGSQWEEFHESFRYADYAIIAAIVAGVVLLGYRMHRRRTHRRAMEERSAEGTGR